MSLYVAITLVRSHYATSSGASASCSSSTKRTTLHSKTLVGLKRLMEVVTDCGGTLAIILAGHSKLLNDLRRPTMEEIVYRSVHFTLDGAIDDRPAYVARLIGA